jgi:N6-adenosine-specific RNA methylase IME4
MTSWRDFIKVHAAANLFPPLEPETFAELVESIKLIGILVAVVTWRDQDGDTWLIDGRNRLDALEQAGIACVDEAGRLCVPTDERTWETDPDPMALAVSLNIHRRHLTNEQKRDIVAKLLQAQPEKSNRAIAEQAKVDDKTVGAVRRELERGAEIPHLAARTGKNGQIHPARKSKQPPIPVTTSDMAARIVKNFGSGTQVGVRTIASKVGNVAPSYVAALMEQLAGEAGAGYRAEKVVGDGNDAVWSVTVVEGAPVLPEEPTKAEKRAAREKALAEKIVALPDKKYGVILADPEWRFEPWSRETGLDRAADNHYATSPTEVIAARDVPSIAAPDCVLFLWATAPMLLDALDVMARWGFKYQTQLVWDKEVIGTGFWFRNQHEILLVGTKGNPIAPTPGTQVSSILREKRGEHSAKPEAIAEMIERIWPSVPKIELNRRGPARPGWDAWGDEALPPEDSTAPADDPATLSRVEG